MKTWKKAIIILICVIIIGCAGFFILGSSSESIGSDDLGSVEKVTYSYYGNTPVKIAIISGMHSREKLHQSVLPTVAKSFALTHPCQIINYKVNVTSDSDKFYEGRENGESLVYDFIIKDLSKEGDVDLVIIGHDHEPGYGEGYYIATPTMDNASVNLAKKVTGGINFNCYQRNTSQSSQSTSINTVDYPIVQVGPKLFVYEIPEYDNEAYAIFMTYRLLEASFEALS